MKDKAEYGPWSGFLSVSYFRRPNLGACLLFRRRLFAIMPGFSLARGIGYTFFLVDAYDNRGEYRCRTVKLSDMAIRT